MTEFTCGLLLALGLLTRPAALMLSYTMGVAYFGFHKLTPIFDMHIAQGFFWLFVVFAAVGGGRLAVDRLLWRFGGSGEQVRLGRMTAIAGPLLMAVMIAGVVLERRNPPTAENGADVAITSINLVGSFNQWNLAAQPMTADGPVWRTRVHFNEPGRIEFKFAANQSWNLSLGAESQPSTTLPLQGVGEPRSGNIAADITAPGDYEFTVDGASFNYAVRPVEPSAQLFDPTNLLGSWQIDLRPTPASEPHLVTLQIDAVEDGVCTGNFYNGSPIQSGRIATNHGVLTFAFVTEDASCG